MAIKKPIVLRSNGELEQLQPGDTIETNVFVLQVINGGGATLPKCGPVSISAADTVVAASAVNRPNVIGVMTGSVASGASGGVMSGGGMVATTAEWDAITGQTGGLTPGVTYFLGSPGLTTTVPTVDFLTRVGVAINSTRLELNISRPIRL